MRREVRGGGVGKHENHTGPKLTVLQQLQSPFDELTFSPQPFQLVQRETLPANTHTQNWLVTATRIYFSRGGRVWGRGAPLWLAPELWWCDWCHCRRPARLSELRGSSECLVRAWTGSVRCGRRSRTCSPDAGWPALPPLAASTDPVAKHRYGCHFVTKCVFNALRYTAADESWPAAAGSPRCSPCRSWSAAPPPSSFRSAPEGSAGPQKFCSPSE